LDTVSIVKRWRPFIRQNAGPGYVNTDTKSPVLIPTMAGSVKWRRVWQSSQLGSNGTICLTGTWRTINYYVR
jgi:hypothetical protein